MGCFLDGLRAFGINVDRWTTAVQGEEEWRRTAEQGAERFMAKYIAAEKASTTCSRMPDRKGKDQGEDNPKQAGSCWFARHS